MTVEPSILSAKEGSASNTKGGFEACDECGMVDGVKGSAEVKKDEDADGTRV